LYAFQSPHAKLDCIQSCTACESLCAETVEYCRKEARLRTDVELITVLQACADICGTSARTLTGGSSVHVHICRACAAVCERAAKLCGDHPGDDLLRACASACTLAARCCSEMVHGFAPLQGSAR
jgi:hypothetical protein